MSNRLSISGGSLRRWTVLALSGLLGCGSASEGHSRASAGGGPSSGASGGGGADSSTTGAADGSVPNNGDAGASGSSGRTEEGGSAGRSSDGGPIEAGVVDGGSPDVVAANVCGDNGAPSFPPAAGILIDFDMSGRSADEVLAPGWNEWIVAEAATDSKTFNGVTFNLSKSGSAGSGLTPVWYKAGVDAPNFSRLVGDGVSVADVTAGGAIQLAISGLSAGSHTLLAYHDGVDATALSPMNVDVDGTRKIANLQPTNRVISPDDAALSYVTFDATVGKTVNIVYSPSTSGSGTQNVILNAIALDIPDPTLQAKGPSPQDRDWHVDADSGTVTLSWIAARGAASHNVYFGTDSAALAQATTSSPLFKGGQSATTYKVSAVSNLEHYYWRVDEVDGGGAVTKGNLWSFSPRHLAFPGAEGYGRFARGGRCGRVVHVTNLDDSGAGSLREAVENDIGPRTIVFDIAGLITLQSRITLASDDVTVAAQTAPGKGITVRSAPFGLSGANDDIMRFIRVRVGFVGITYDGTGMQGSDHSIMDHVSVSWTIDEAFSSRNANNVTLQRTLIAESLNDADHTNAAGEVSTAHGFAGTISGKVGSYHHNLLAHNEGRNFSMGAAIDGGGNFVSKLDLFNNVVYNFGGRANDGQVYQANFVNNYYKEGAATRIDFTFSMDFENYGVGTLQAYYAGNVLQKSNGTFTCDGKDNACGRRFTLTNGNPAPTWEVFPTSGPFFPSYATIQSANDAYKTVLSDVGMTMPVFDDHDQRMIRETLAGTTMYKGSLTGLPGLIDRETDAGGFESYPTTTRPAGFDTDGDGLPDWYETYIGTNAKSAAGSFSDPNADPDGDGYTNLEEYLQWMATPHVEVKTATAGTFDLAGLFRGYTKSPTFKAGASSCLTTSVTNSALTVTPKSACGIVYLPVTVTDADGGTMTRSVGVFVTGSVMSP